MRVWLITGCSRGLGRALAEEALDRGDVVVATARRLDDLEDLVARRPEQCLGLELDVTDHAAVRAVADAALGVLGHVDVLVNNAGYGHLGAVEEVTEAEAREQLETNFFGPLALTQALLPHMRARRAGCIVNASSHSGFAAFPGFGLYAASKFALEGLSEALALELAPLGVHVTIVEPGPFRTDWAGPSLHRSDAVIEDYAGSSGRVREFMNGWWGHQPGDPAAAARAIADAVTSETPPLRLLLGRAAIDEARAKLASFARDVDASEAVAVAADFAAAGAPDGVPPAPDAYAALEDITRT